MQMINGIEPRLNDTNSVKPNNLDKTVPVQIYSSRGLTRVRTWASAVRYWLLIAWAMTEPGAGCLAKAYFVSVAFDGEVEHDAPEFQAKRNQ